MGGIIEKLYGILLVFLTLLVGVLTLWETVILPYFLINLLLLLLPLSIIIIIND